MNRKLVYKNIMINLGHIDVNEVLDDIVKNFEQSSIKIQIINRRYEEYNCYVECNIEVTYKMVTYLLKDISFRDMYYLFSKQQTVTKEEILHRLIERDIIKDLILRKV